MKNNLTFPQMNLLVTMLEKDLNDKLTEEYNAGVKLKKPVDKIKAHLEDRQNNPFDDLGLLKGTLDSVIALRDSTSEEAKELLKAS